MILSDPRYNGTYLFLKNELIEFSAKRTWALFRVILQCKVIGELLCSLVAAAYPVADLGEGGALGALAPPFPPIKVPLVK